MKLTYLPMEVDTRLLLLQSPRLLLINYGVHIKLKAFNRLVIISRENIEVLSTESTDNVNVSFQEQHKQLQLLIHSWMIWPPFASAQGQLGLPLDSTQPFPS